MILSDVSIRQRMRHGEHRISVEPFDETCLQPASIDLHLGPTILEVDPWAIAEGRVVDMEAPDDSIWREVNIANGGYVLAPGQCILGETAESVVVPPDLVGELWGKSSRARLFLIIHSTAGYADPGFCGRWTLEIKNIFHLPLRLRAGMKIAQMKYSLLDRITDRPYGTPGLGSRYLGQNSPTPAKAEIVGAKVDGG